MITFTKKHLFSILLLIIALLLVTELTLYILWGYTSGDIFIFLLINFVPRIRYAFTTICIAVTIWLLVKHQHKMFFTISWIILTILGYILSQNHFRHFEALGGLLSVYNSTPDQILNDARILADKYPPMTCIGYHNQREPCNNAISRDNIPDSIKSMRVGNILILENYVLIEKFGLQGVFRGFVAFRNGFDLWKTEAAVTRNNCNDCWKIRIIDGLYWYSANPSVPPIFIEPLK